MTDTVVRELERVGARGGPRGAAVVYAAARDDAGLITVDPASGRRVRRGRGSLVLRAAMVVLVVALALVVAVSRQTSSGRPLAPTDLLPSQIFDPRRQQVDEWLDGYDPAEIQYLYDKKDESFGDISDEYLLGTLEFRRSCRFVQRAIDAAGSATSDVERAEAVALILEPQIARFVERIGTEGDSDETWHRLMTRLQAGDVGAVQAYLGDSCARSFGPWIDD